MSSNPVMCKMSEMDTQALDKMTSKGISRVIVVDEHDQARGVVSADHILKSKVHDLEDLAHLSSKMHKREDTSQVEIQS